MINVFNENGVQSVEQIIINDTIKDLILVGLNRHLHRNQLQNKKTAKFQSEMKREIYVTTYVGLLMFCLFVMPTMKQSAFSDGLFQENLPPATVGDRQASLFTKVSPPVLTSDSHQKRFFELRLY